MPTEFRRETVSFSSGRTYTFRSGWEENYAYYLEWLKEQGEIKDWEYEPTPRYDFIAYDNKETARMGTGRVLGLGYLPDFKVTNNDGSFYLVEIKGRRQGMMKLKRMKKFYPKIRIELVEAKEYNALKRKLGRMLNFN
jgi:uncharacterized protein DUF1064